MQNKNNDHRHERYTRYKNQVLYEIVFGYRRKVYHNIKVYIYLKKIKILHRKYNTVRELLI